MNVVCMCVWIGSVVDALVRMGLYIIGTCAMLNINPARLGCLHTCYRRRCFEAGIDTPVGAIRDEQSSSDGPVPGKRTKEMNKRVW